MAVKTLFVCHIISTRKASGIAGAAGLNCRYTLYDIKPTMSERQRHILASEIELRSKMTNHGEWLSWKRAPISVDIDECAIGLEPCRASQQCVNLPGSFRCQRRQRPGSDDQVDDEERIEDEEDGGRQRDVAVGEEELDGDGRRPGVTEPPTERTSSSFATTTRTTRARTTTARRHRPSGLRCGTGFHYNRRTGRCEGIRDEKCYFRLKIRPYSSSCSVRKLF